MLGIQRRIRGIVAALILLAPSAIADAQATPAGTTPVLTALSHDELDALRPLADRGVGLLVRDVAAGTRARITVLVHVHAPMATLHDVVATPEQYPQFMTSIDQLEITGRHGSFIGIRAHTSLTIFNVDTLATLHLVSPSRVDGTLMQSQLGPGGLRWDFYPDGDNCYVAYTTWSDPSQANWFIRQVAASSPAAIAGLEMSYDVMLALIVGRRAEHLAGRSPAGMPAHAAVDPGTIAPPPPGPWMDLTHDRVIGAVSLDPSGATMQSSTAMWTDAPVDAVRARLEDVQQYSHVWPELHATVGGTGPNGGVRYHAVIDSSLFHAEGDEERVVQNGPQPVILWHGLTGDLAHDEMRWDLVPAQGGGTVVVLSGGSDLNRTGIVFRAVIDRVPWMLPGYGPALKLVWLRALLAAH